MLQPYKYRTMFQAGCRQSVVVLATWLLLSGVVAAQYLPAAESKQDLLPLGPNLIPLRSASSLVPGVKANEAVPPASSKSLQAYNGGIFSTSNSGDAPTGVRRITLEEAEQMATGGSNPLVRLGELQVEIAKQHRLGVQAMYFPNIGAQFLNMHFNKHPGKVLTVHSPLGGGFLGVPVNIVNKDETAFNLSVVQPITPLFSIHQLVKIARADENIARAKAGMPVAEIASKVEKSYFELLIAERELISAGADSDKIQAKWLTASTSTAPRISVAQETDMIAAEKALTLSTSKVKELTASLAGMIGLPEGTRLELIPPAPLEEDLTLQEVADKTAANPEVIAAEQTAVKAHAGSKLSRLEYLPSLAVIGGYTNQNMMNIILPRDFSYIGLMATFTVFDFGKREHGVKEARAQAEAADLGVQLTKAKVAETAKKAYFELSRARELSQLARRMYTASPFVNASYEAATPDTKESRAVLEMEVLTTELAHREAYAHLKELMGSK